MGHHRERAFITRRLIQECGFNAVAIEDDWPDVYRVNRFARRVGSDEDASEERSDFGRFPTWMWRNADVLDFVGWLTTHTDTAVLAYLDKVDPPAAARARSRYGCFDRFGDELQHYGYAAGFGLGPSCEREVVTQLVELTRQRAEYASAMFRGKWSRGTSGIGIWPKPSPSCSHFSKAACRGRSSSSGCTTPIWAMRVPRRWGNRAN